MSKKEEKNFRHQLPACLNNLLRFLLCFVLQWLPARRNIRLTSHPWLQHLNSGCTREEKNGVSRSSWLQTWASYQPVVSEG